MHLISAPSLYEPNVKILPPTVSAKDSGMFFDTLVSFIHFFTMSFNRLSTSILWLSSSSDSKQPCGLRAASRASVSSISADLGSSVLIGAVMPKLLVCTLLAVGCHDVMVAAFSLLFLVK